MVSLADAHVIADLIGRKAGFVVELRDLAVCRMRNGRFQVVDYSKPEPQSREFETAMAAAHEFCQVRKFRNLGFDLDDDLPPDTCVG